MGSPLSFPDECRIGTDLRRDLALWKCTQLANSRYVQFRVAVPRIVWAVLSMPLLIVSCKFTGALAVMVTCPLVLQVASPASSMLATPGLELLQLKPSTAVIVRLELLVKIPLAVKPTVPLLIATAEAGLTLTVFKLG